LAAVELAGLGAQRDRARDHVVATDEDVADLGLDVLDRLAVRVGLGVARLVALGEQRAAGRAERLVHGVGVAARDVPDLLPLALQILDLRDRLAPATLAGRGVGDLLRTRDQRLLLGEVLGLLGLLGVEQRLAAREELVARGA